MVKLKCPCGKTVKCGDPQVVRCICGVTYRLVDGDWGYDIYHKATVIEEDIADAIGDKVFAFLSISGREAKHLYLGFEDKDDLLKYLNNKNSPNKVILDTEFGFKYNDMRVLMLRVKRHIGVS